MKRNIANSGKKYSQIRHLILKRRFNCDVTSQCPRFTFYQWGIKHRFQEWFDFRNTVIFLSLVWHFVIQGFSMQCVLLWPFLSNSHLWEFPLFGDAVYPFGVYPVVYHGYHFFFTWQTDVTIFLYSLREIFDRIVQLGRNCQNPFHQDHNSLFNTNDIQLSSTIVWVLGKLRIFQCFLPSELRSPFKQQLWNFAFIQKNQQIKFRVLLTNYAS